MSKKFGLTPEELTRFRDNGFIGPFDLYEADEIKAKFKRIRAELFDRSHAAYQLDAKSAIAGYDRHLDINDLSEHVMRREIVDKVSDILGPDVVCWRSELFPKYPGDEGTDWHQADTYAHASGEPQIIWPQNSKFGGAITVWTALSDATIENGCMRFMPGTHEEMFYDESKGMKFEPDLVNKRDVAGEKRGFFGYDYRNLQKDPDWCPDESKAVSMQMRAGQFVIFWSTCMHASHPNSTTNQTRMGFAARFVPSSVQVYPGTDFVEEYGSRISLDNFGVVVVSGKNDYSHNRVVTQNRRGLKFAIPE